MRLWIWIWIWIAIGIGSVAITLAASLLPGQLRPREREMLVRFQPTRELDPFPPIVDPLSISAREAEGLIEPGESVLGVEVNGHARAYPVDMIHYISKELLNDTLGGVPIAVSWCELCQSGVVHDRRVEDRVLSFRVSGMLWQGNMVMEDVETGTLWGQLLGQGLEGELAGATLEGFPVTLTTWNAWRARFPETSVLLLDRERIRPPMRREYLAHHERFPPQFTDQFLLALACGDEAIGWSLAYLRDQEVINEQHCGRPVLVVYDREENTALAFQRRVEGEVLTFREEGDQLVDEQTGTVWDSSTGRGMTGPLVGKLLRPVVATVSYAKTWLKFYPRTSVFNLGGRAASNYDSSSPDGASGVGSTVPGRAYE